MSTRVRERREATKAAILDTAWEIARAQGLGAIGMRELARRLGMTAPSLYEYFENKDAIFDAMYVQGNRALIERADASIPPADADARASLIAAARLFVEFCNEDTARFQLMFQHAIPGWAPSPEAYDVAVQALDEASRHLAECGFDGPGDLDLWTALTSGLASQQVANDPGGDRWIRLIEPAVDMYIESRDRS